MSTTVFPYCRSDGDTCFLALACCFHSIPKLTTNTVIITIMKSVRSPDINCSNKQFTVGFSVPLCSLLPKTSQIWEKKKETASYSVQESQKIDSPLPPHSHLRPATFTVGRNCQFRENKVFALPPLTTRLCLVIAEFQELFGCHRVMSFSLILYGRGKLFESKRQVSIARALLRAWCHICLHWLLTLPRRGRSCTDTCSWLCCSCQGL